MSAGNQTSPTASSSSRNLAKTATSLSSLHPKASYEQVVADERVFMETLEYLHKSLGTKFLVPTIGGKSLDLHRLFVEVTCRGGLQKVIGDRKWKEVTSVFASPSTIASASFVLRKYYISLLQTYEQVYYFRKRDSKLPSNDAKASKKSEAPIATVSTMPKRTVEHQIPDSKASTKSEAPIVTVSTTPKRTVEHQIPEHPPLRVGSLVKGKIHGKFENGYLVSVNYGTETLNGVLYHVALQPIELQNSSISSHGRSRKKSRGEADPSILQSNMGGYNIFFEELYSKVMPLYSGKEKVIVKHINCLWNKLTDSEKEVYRQRDRERWQVDALEY